MKKTNVIISAIFICIVFVNACKKDDHDAPPSSSDLSSLQEFYDRHAPVSQVFTINAQLDQTITGTQGTKVTFGKNVLIKSNGQPATGTVIIELKEIYKKSDMLYADKPTVTSTIPLKSGGEVFLKATLEATGEELMVIDSVPAVNILFPDDAPIDTMLAFVGADSANQFIWEPMISSGWQAVAFSTVGGYTIQTDTLTWINCDQPVYSSPWVKFTMNANEPVSEYSTDVFLFFPDKTVIHVYKEYGSSASRFPNRYTPCNSDFTAVAIGFRNGTLYSSFTAVEVGTTDHEISFSLTPTTEAALTVALEDLN